MAAQARIRLHSCLKGRQKNFKCRTQASDSLLHLEQACAATDCWLAPAAPATLAPARRNPAPSATARLKTAYPEGVLAIPRGRAPAAAHLRDGTATLPEFLQPTGVFPAPDDATRRSSARDKFAPPRQPNRTHKTGKSSPRREGFSNNRDKSTSCSQTVCHCAKPAILHIDIN
jgi:hypothetical protein